MKKFLTIACITLAGTVLVSCSKVRRNPGRVYMPDMSYSRAYETYASTEALKNEHVNYNALPVEGTIARGDLIFVNTLKNDSAGYAESSSLQNPLTADSTFHIDMKETERLFLVNCAICHGPKLDGNGPLWKDGNGPFPNKPAALVGDAKYVSMSDGTMYFSITNGRNAMGAYKSQLNPRQRWMMVSYIRSKQAAAATTSTGPTAAKDSNAVKPSAK
jgi:mono/diheme cytochrome c family protein